VAESGIAYAWKTVSQAYGSHEPFGFKSIFAENPNPGGDAPPISHRFRSLPLNGLWLAMSFNLYQAYLVSQLFAGLNTWQS
jgi:hypothetical protein